MLGVVAFGFSEIVVFGGKLTRHVYSAGLPSMLPIGSIARTLKLWMPSVRPAYGGSIGTSHSVQAELSSEHSNVESISLAVKVKFAVVAVVTGSGFALMNVSGGTATSQMYSAGVSSLSPSGLRAATSNVCSPSIRFAVRLRRGAERELGPVERAEEDGVGLVGREV